jgi:hypothetical protein
MALRIVPLTLGQANELVSRLHRHHKPVVGHRFSIGAMDGDVLIGASIVGRPVARENPHYMWAEVTRLVTDGTKNASSLLYAASARIAREMGFERIQTFILAEETGVSLRAAGWEFEHATDGGDWNRPSRGGRRMDQPQQSKQRWKKELNQQVQEARGRLTDLLQPALAL